MSDANTENKQRAVLVENLSPSVTEKTLKDFFFLCGPIESITLNEQKNAQGDAEESLVAVVVFEESSAAETAVLLTNAVLVDRAITVRFFFPETGLCSARTVSTHTPSRVITHRCIVRQEPGKQQQPCGGTCGSVSC